MEIKEFKISIKGDPSVGIPDQDYILSGDFEFDSKTHLDEFESALADAFEILLTERVSIVSRSTDDIRADIETLLK